MPSFAAKCTVSSDRWSWIQWRRMLVGGRLSLINDQASISANQFPGSPQIMPLSLSHLHLSTTEAFFYFANCQSAFWLLRVMTQDTSQIRMNAGAQSLMTPLPCFVRRALFSGYLSPHYGLATGSSLTAPGPDSNILQAFLNLSHEECLTK